jgi:cellulose synthase/poly-beta-1,6-N-acetylglucosamine synthase-like glycosyltransferase
MPCKGTEPELQKNIRGLLNQEYGDYHTAIVTDTAEDPAYAVAQAVLAQYPAYKARVYTSETYPGASGKVAALLTVLTKTWNSFDVYAFADSDSFMPPRWLADVIEPLRDGSVGATTGFRWYFPSGGGFWSHVEAAWNAAGTNLMFNERYNFPWGGAMAIRSETLDKVGIERLWANAISDDMTLNLALRKHGLRIQFLPQCTVATFNKTTFKELVEWATRQTTLTKIYNRGLWNYATAAYMFFNLSFLLGASCAVLGAALNAIWFIPALLLLLPTFFGILRSYQRSETFARALPEFKREFNRTRFLDSMASFIVPWIMTYCIINSAGTHEIVWRGRRYKLTRLTPDATS